MNPRIRTLIAAAAGLGLAVYGANDLAQGHYLVAAALTVVIFWVLAEWSNAALPEAWVIAVTVVGYVVGNRGFAQILVVPSLPIPPAEGALALAGCGLAMRSALGRKLPFRIDALNLAVLLWMAYGTARLPLDVKVYKVIALRDFALIYYASFFFIAQWLTSLDASYSLLRRAMDVAFVLLPLVVVANRLAPQFFLSTLTLNGNPVIFHKSDLISAYLVAGTLWFWARRELGGSRAWLLVAALSLLLGASTESPRAALVAGAATTTAWLLARRFGLFGFLSATVVVALAAALPIELMRGTALDQTHVYELYERTVSLVDWGGHHTYRNAESATVTDNNQFRLVWWKSVIGETLESDPVFGMGFGYDLAARFLVDYDWIEIEDFSTRSPHSVLVTNFGRLGAIGLALFLVVGGLLVASARRSFKVHDFETMAWWSVAATIGGSAAFGVVLEGPMGAVLFWTAAGIAHERSTRLEAQSSESSADALPEAVEMVSSGKQ